MTSDEAWLSRVRRDMRPIYEGVVAALEAAIAEGELQPGDRLPAQRAVAARLGVDLTTVTRAYDLARRRGLLEGAVGRGTFVRQRPEEDEGGLVDLSMNLPPPPDGLSLATLIGETLTGVLARTDAARLMAYHPEFGALGQRRAGAAWLAPCLGERAPEQVLVAPGAQAALAAALSTLCRTGDAVLCEPLTYPGFLSVTAQLGLRAVACPADADGVQAEALKELCARERPVAAYLVPAMQNPTAGTMPEDRRRDVAQVLDLAGVWLIEDDPYSRLLEAPAPAICSHLTSRFVYIATLAKTLSPGLRIAYAVTADAADAERLATALRALALMPPPLMAALATVWMREGRAEALLDAVRREARARRAIAAARLPGARGGAESLHVWLPLPPGASPEHLRTEAQRRGLALVTQDAFAATPAAPPGVRVSLGGPGRRAVLDSALSGLAQALDAPGPRRTVV
ncbi:MAG TPA: PLP-dependent aminotransferase family protein [Caulobacteraceae bacterium]